VDDCTPDKSIEILERVMEDYPNRKEQIRIIRHEKNRGLAAARNTALDAATSPFITHVDSDDYLSLDAIKLLVEKQVETGADIVSGNYFIIESNGTRKAFEPDYADQHEMMRMIFSVCSGSRTVWRRLIKRSLYDDNHIRTIEGIDFYEDWQQTPLLVYYAKKVAKLNDYIYFYNRTNNESYVSNFLRNKELWRQSIESALFVDNFFACKEREYHELAHRTAITILKFRMSLTARYRGKAFFEEIKRIIMSDYTDCWDEVGWDNTLVRAFMCNYTMNSFYRRSIAWCKQVFFPLNMK
jgi:glycosyltransferase involved in cell wall biosynthesis